MGILKKHWPLISIFLIEWVLFFANFRSGTFLVGWDSLYPELNFAESLKRSLFGVWQEYRGLGLYDGMAHAANLPHTLFIWLLHFFLPVHIIRYFFVFLMHLLGGLGIYILLRHLLRNHLCAKILAFFGALFYLFNLATIQMFFTPFEVFAVHFAFLPWLTLSLLNYLKTPIKKNLFLFTLLSLLSTPQAFVPQVFAAYILLISSILAFSLIQKGKVYFCRVLLILAAIFFVNAFWVLPYVFGLPGNSKVIIEAKINEMSSKDVYLKNKARGTFENVLWLRGFMLDVTEPAKDGKPGYIMEAWRTHSESIWFKIVATIVVLSTLVGIVQTLRSRQAYFYPFIFVFTVGFAALSSNTPGFEIINELIRNTSPVLKEAFRFSFTKFSIIFTFCYTIFLTLGLGFLMTFLKRNLHIVFLTVLGGTLFFYGYPVFRGDLFFDSLRLKIPNDYFQSIEFFKEQGKGTRIATFPQPTFWSWRFNNWGYRGSGFLWYGIEQPILDRAFDPWSKENGNYYWEISYALYSKNQELFEKILEKYQVNWVLVDGNVINPSSPKALFLDELEEMLKAADKFKPAVSFGKIKIYQVQLDTPINNFVYLAQNIPVIEPGYKWNNFDAAFAENNHYISQIPNSRFQIPNPTIYPFRSLFAGKKQEDIEFNVEEKENSFVFTKTFTKPLQNYTLEIPDIDTKALAWINPYDLSRQKFLHPDVFFDGKSLTVEIPKIKGYLSEQIDPAYDSSLAVPKNCSQLENGTVQNEIVKEKENLFLRLFASNAINCSASFFLPNLPHNLGYLISVEAKNRQGKGLLFWLENQNTRKADLETYLPEISNLKSQILNYFVQPPMQEDGVGYSLHFDNISIGNDKTINDLGKITVNPIPYEFLTRLKLEPANLPTEKQRYFEVEVEHPNPSLYTVTKLPSYQVIKSPVLVLSQAYDLGWNAYIPNSRFQILNSQILVPFFGKKIENHVLVDNWANGWILDKDRDGDGEIMIIFLPQYLEYLGFLLLIIFGLAILKNRMADTDNKTLKDIIKEEKEGQHGHNPSQSPAVRDEEEASGSSPGPTSDDDIDEMVKEVAGREPEPGETFTDIVNKAEESRRRPPEEPEPQEET